VKRADIGLLVCCLLLLGACSQVLDMEVVESGIKDGLNERDAEKGDTFQCTVSADGDTATVRVEQTDDEGNVNWELVQE
jgi:major membrane immunogen (membrane-anchored lipoprotein)